MITYQSDLVSNINKVIFSILSPERILQMSSREIYRHITGNYKDHPGTQSDNRLGGSKSAYSKNYKPMDPNKFPRPYDAIWSGY